MWQKLSKCYPPRLELISLLLLALTFYVALSNYAALPESIPTHFNAQGIPDDWGNKGAIFLFPTLAALLIFLPMTFLNIWLAIVDDPKRLISLPKKRMEALTEAQAEGLRIFMNRSLFLLKVLILGLMGYCTWNIVEVALGRASGLGAGFFLLISAIIILSGFMVWKGFYLTRAPTETRFD